MVMSWQVFSDFSAWHSAHIDYNHRTLATNCARVYNTSLLNESVNVAVPAAFPTQLELDTKDVWNGFFLYSLLIDHMEQGSVLEMQHNASS
jgi:hypothetical protein